MDELNMIAMILWSLWNSRNDLIWNRWRKSSNWIFHAAFHTLIQWQQARVPPVPQRSHKDVSSSLRWKKPKPGWVKCNIDAAMFNQFQCIRIGYVIKYENGVIITVRNAIIRGPLDPTIAEAMNYRKILS